LLKKILDLFFFSHLPLALAAAGLTWTTGELLHQRLPPSLPWLAGAATLTLYNFDAMVPYKRHQPATTARGVWLRLHESLLAALALIGLVGTAFFAWPILQRGGGWQGLRLLLPLGLLAGLYSIPILPWNGRLHPLRDVPMFKGVLIAAVWAGVTVQLPALLGSPPAPLALNVLLARRFLLILALTLGFDLRDLEKDRVAGTRTVPLLLGPRRTRWLAWSLLAIIPWLRPAGLSAAHGLLLASPIVAAAVFVGGARPGRSDYYYAGFGDGILLLPALAEWIVGHL
jgi:4-hydroxybenzoate polyprenyltransferase